MNEDDYAELSVLVDATIVVDRIDLDDSDNDLIYTDIDAKDLAIHNKYSLNYGDKVFVDPRSLRVYMNVYICVSIEVTLDDKKVD